MVRTFQIAVIGWLSVWLMGCAPAEKQKPVWEKVKIGDIAPTTGKPSIEPLSTINLVVHIFEMPAENVGKLENILQTLYTTPLRFNNYYAFRANWFSVRFGQIEMWNKTLDLLRAVGGRRIVKISLLLPDSRPSDLAVTALNSRQIIFYVSTDGTRESAPIGPGVLALRIKAQKIPTSKGVCNLTAWPVFSPPIRSSVTQLAASARLRELPFDCAGFGLKMSPGDFVILGPEKYISDQMALAGLFFSKPEGSMFFSENEREPPQLKPAVRIFLLVCTGINY